MSSIRGPLGIWPFPLLNALMSLGQGMGGGRFLGQGLLVGARPVAAENYERVVWTDWRGRERSVEAHREVM